MVDIRKIIESIGVEDGILNESSFSSSKLQKVSDLLALVLGKSLGAEFKQLGGSLGTETFKKRGHGEGKGFKYMNKRGQMIRFGWLKKSKKSKFQINIVDYWDPKDGQRRWDTPTLSIKLADWLNIVDVVQELKSVIVSGGTDIPGVFEGLINENENFMSLNEAINKKLIAYAVAVGIDQEEAEGLTPSRLITLMKKNGVWDEDEYKGFKVIKNEVERNSTEDTFKSAEKMLQEKKWSDPELIFDDIEKLTKIVATGGSNGLIVAGMAGMGKCLCKETEIPVFGL